MQIKVSHQSIVNNWINPDSIHQPKTLVLGSFNPFNENSESVDYYYGRSSNYFWRSIASVIGRDEECFFGNKSGLMNKIEIMQNRFCCMDVINHITFNTENEQILESYIQNEIYANFLDQKIWTSRTNYTGSNSILISREYNQRIIDFLQNNQSITKIIHTMGSNRINEKTVYPKENRLGQSGLNGYFNSIKEICKSKGIEIIYESWSPSAYAIRRGSTDKVTLQNWLKQHLNLNQFNK
jgi:hypothetical protein